VFGIHVKYTSYMCLDVCLQLYSKNECPVPRVPGVTQHGPVLGLGVLVVTKWHCVKSEVSSVKTATCIL
jgi:hypothetical protein